MQIAPEKIKKVMILMILQENKLEIEYGRKIDKSWYYLNFDVLLSEKFQNLKIRNEIIY